MNHNNSSTKTETLCNEKTPTKEEVKEMSIRLNEIAMETQDLIDHIWIIQREGVILRTRVLKYIMTH